MNREYNSRVSSKNSERLLKNLKNTTGDYFFMPHPVDLWKIPNHRNYSAQPDRCNWSSTAQITFLHLTLMWLLLA